MKHQKLSLSSKLSRLTARLRDAGWRRYDGLLLAGKLLGILLLMLAVYLANPGLMGLTTFAADAPPALKGNDIVNPLNTVWTLIVTVATFSVAFAVMYVVNAMGLLRVSPEGESLGLDIHEHGISVYPEYVVSSTGSPSPMHLPAHATITVESRIRTAAPESAS